MTGRPNDAAHTARHRSEGIWQPPRGDLVRVGSPTRRWFLQAGLTGFAGLSMAQLLQLQAARRGGESALLVRTEGRHPVLALGRAEPPRHVGPEARRAEPGAGAVRNDPDRRARGAVLRASAAASGDHGQADGRAVDGLLGQQPHADHDAGGQPAGPADRRRQGRRGLPGHGLGGGAVPGRERPVAAGVRRPGR